MQTLNRVASASSLRPRRPALRGVAVVSATAIAVGIWGVARALGIEVLSPEMGGDPAAEISALQVVMASGVASLAGWGLLEALERVLVARAQQTWLIIAAIVQLASLVSPLGGAGITTANQVVLVLLHLGVAAVLVPGLVGVQIRPSKVDS